MKNIWNIYYSWLYTSYLILLCSIFNKPNAENYYVDFANGNNKLSGTTPKNAWKNTPGDEFATDIPTKVTINHGDTLFFKGGVTYRGQINIASSGDQSRAVTYCGDKWPGLEGQKAIIDGSESVSGWTNDGNNIYSADISSYFPANVSPIAINLHNYSSANGNDNFMWISQAPNPTDPFFYDDVDDFNTVQNQNITRTSIRDTVIFNQSNPDYWKDSYVLIWVNPNMVVTREIQNFEPTSNTITFKDLGVNAIYPDGRDQKFAIYNSIHALDKEGEYCINKSLHKIFCYTNNPQSLDKSITFASRKVGININGRSFLNIEGFIVQKHSGEELRDGVGIGCYSSTSSNIRHITIKNNEIRHNRHSEGGYGGIYLTNVSNCLIEGNLLVDNPKQKGIFISSAFDVVIKNNNVVRTGCTSISFYRSNNCQIIYNTIRESNGTHANGITIYIASKNILIAGNKIYDSGSPITFQDAGNLYFINNIIDANGRISNVNEWGRTSRGPWESGKIIFLNNTFVNNSNNTSLNIGSGIKSTDVGDSIIPANTYIVKNNIIDGGFSDSLIERSHNIYTGLSWHQDSRYGWSFAEGELLVEDMKLIFESSENGDFDLFENSQARNQGTNVSKYYPTDQFPDFDFTVDINGNVRTNDGIIDIGSYEYGKKINSIRNMSDFHMIQKPFFQSLMYSPLSKCIVINYHNSIYNNIHLFDLHGKSLFTVPIRSGTNTLIVDRRGMANGVFLIGVDGFKNIRKMILF